MLAINRGDATTCNDKSSMYNVKLMDGQRACHQSSGCIKHSLSWAGANIEPARTVADVAMASEKALLRAMRRIEAEQHAQLRERKPMNKRTAGTCLSFTVSNALTKSINALADVRCS